MATTEEMSLCREVFNLALIITAQGEHKIHLSYAAHIDMLAVWVDGCPLGWQACEHDCYLGDFYRQSWDEEGNRKGAEALERLIAELEALVIRDADGVPV